MGGTYTDIVEIEAPRNAVAGEMVSVQVRVKNTYSGVIGLMCGGALEYGVSPWPKITFPDDQANVGAGVTQTFQGYITMPGAGVKIHAYSYYYASDGAWHFDDEQTQRVSVAELKPEFSEFVIADYAVV